MRLILSTLLFALFFNDVFFSQEVVTKVSVIAPSIFTSMKAREILNKMKWKEATPKNADYILVVVRSTFLYPLKTRYDSYRELKNDAERLLNITGYYHLYLFYVEDDLSVREFDHKYFEDDD